MKNIILVKNLNEQEQASRLERALSETSVDFEINLEKKCLLQSRISFPDLFQNLEKKCVIVEGNSDMVAIARKIVSDNGFMII